MDEAGPTQQLPPAAWHVAGGGHERPLTGGGGKLCQRGRGAPFGPAPPPPVHARHAASHCYIVCTACVQDAASVEPLQRVLGRAGGG